jgi:hypothetical protein
VRATSSTPLPAFADPDHFVDINKMIGHKYAGILTGGFGLLDYVQEVSPFRIAQEFLQVTRAPTFDAVVQVTRLLEFLKEFDNDLWLHAGLPVSCRSGD